MFNTILENTTMPKPLVFLGGTCGDSKWRELLMPQLEIDYFNPVVDDWKPEDQEKELEVRSKADYLLYVITPKASGMYSAAEVADDSNKRPKKTIFCYLASDGGSIFTAEQVKSMDSIGRMVEANGGTWLKSLDEVAKTLNMTPYLNL